MFFFYCGYEDICFLLCGNNINANYGVIYKYIPLFLSIA